MHFIIIPDFVWQTEADLLTDNAAGRGNVVVMTFSNSPYSNDSHVHIDSGEHRHAVANIFEHTQLIDRFNAEDEMEESLFEKIEMDPELDWNHQEAAESVPATEQPLRTTTKKFIHQVPRARADDYEAESYEPPPPSPAPPVHRKGKNKSGHHKNRKQAHGRRKNRKETEEEEEEFDSKLELKPERNVPFDKLNNFEMGPQSIQFEVNKNGRRQYQTQRPKATGGGGNNDDDEDDVHVVRPQNPETVDFTVDSKIIDIKPNRDNKRIKRETEYAQSTLAHSNGTAEDVRNQNALAAFLNKFFGVQPPHETTESRKWMALPALEFLNLAVAIMVWSVRYPSVFWATSKPFSIIFTLQLVANGLSIMFDYMGGSVLYKLQVVNEAAGIKSSTLLLNTLVTISLMILSILLTLGSSHILYMYGHGKLSLKMRERKVISVKSSETWIYFSHCASLCFVLALAVVKAPLLHDLTMTYRENLNGTVFASGKTTSFFFGVPAISLCQLDN